MIDLLKVRTSRHEDLIGKAKSFDRKRSSFTTDCGRRTATLKNIFACVESQNSVLLLTDYGIWGSSEYREIYRRLRKSQGLPQNYWENPTEVFTKPSDDEWKYLMACTIYAALAIWGATVYFEKDDFLIYFGHDEDITAWFGPKAKREVKEEVAGIIKAAGK